jgi:hypothetical protein
MSIFDAVVKTASRVLSSHKEDKRQSFEKAQSKASEFDVGAFAREQLGGEISAYDNINGMAKVKVFDEKTQEEVERDFDFGSMVKEQFGKELNQWKPVVNSPESALQENGLDFAERSTMASLSRPSDKVAFLKKKYGEDNVAVTPQGLRVKQSNVWKVAEEGALGEFGKDIPSLVATTAGAAKGASLGAAAGTFVAPGPGTLVGGLVGGAVGAGLAALVTKGVQDKTLEVAGIKTEEDADHALKEMGKAGIEAAGWQLALGSAGKLASAAWRGPGGRIMAGALEKITGTPADDFLVTFGLDDAAKHVSKSLALDKAAAERALKEGTFQGILPSQRKLAITAQRSLDKMHQAASADYGSMIDDLAGQGVLTKAAAQVDDVAESFSKGLKDVGLVDETGRWIKAKEAARRGIPQEVFDSKSQAKLESMYNNLWANSKGRKMSFEQLTKLRKNVDEILRASNVFANPDAMTPKARNMALSFRAQLRAKEVQSLAGHSVKLQGKVIDAAEYYNSGLRKYSKFIDAYDNIAIPPKAQINDVIKGVNKVFKENSIEARMLQQSYKDAATYTGRGAEQAVKELRIAKAASNLSDLYVGSIVSPKSAVTKGTVGTNKLLSGQSKILAGPAHVVNYLTSITPEEQLMLLRNPQLVRTLWDAPAQAEENAAQFQDDLFNQAQQQIGQ